MPVPVPGPGLTGLPAGPPPGVGPARPGRWLPERRGPARSTARWAAGSGAEGREAVTARTRLSARNVVTCWAVSFAENPLKAVVYAALT